ncbi:terminase small subunit [Escherichia coli]
MEVNKKQLADILVRVSVPLARTGRQEMSICGAVAQGNEVLYDSAAVKMVVERDAEIKTKAGKCGGVQPASGRSTMRTNAIDLRVRRPTHRN